MKSNSLSVYSGRLGAVCRLICRLLPGFVPNVGRIAVFVVKRVGVLVVFLSGFVAWKTPIEATKTYKKQDHLPTRLR